MHHRPKESPLEKLQRALKKQRKSLQRTFDRHAASAFQKPQDIKRLEESQRIEEKLELGIERLKRYEKEEDWLGPAMISIHGALEDQFRYILVYKTSTLSDEEKLRVQDAGQVQWKGLLELMKQHHNLSESDAKKISAMNRLRIDAGHGGKFDGNESQVSDYATFVQEWVKFNDKPDVNIISRLVLLGLVMLLFVQFFHANGWQFFLLKSYTNDITLSFFIVALGIARTACIWQNNWVGFGLFLTTIGGFSWQYKWIKFTLPFITINKVPLPVDESFLIFIGICIIIYGLFPQLLGWIIVIPGGLMLSIELWLVLTKGLAAIHIGNLLISIILLGISVLMFQRQKSLDKKGGAFRKKIIFNKNRRDQK